MPLPTSYDEAGCAASLHGRLNQGGVADAFGWSIAAGSYKEVINDTLLAYGADDVAEATDIRKLRALGNLALWQAAKAAAVLQISYTADGTTFNRQAIFQHIEAMLGQARYDAIPYLDDAAYAVSVYGVRHNDPYQPLVDVR
jgi:hypothetical protein